MSTNEWDNKTWWWAEITRNVKGLYAEDELETNAARCEAILTAHGVEVDINSSDPQAGSYLIVLPRFPESVEVLEIQLQVGELQIVVQG